MSILADGDENFTQTIVINSLFQDFRLTWSVARSLCNTKPLVH